VGRVLTASDVDCGAAYDYTVRIEATESLPSELVVVHVAPDGDGEGREFLVPACR
jgi:hypothetical protein